MKFAIHVINERLHLLYHQHERGGREEEGEMKGGREGEERGEREGEREGGRER